MHGLMNEPLPDKAESTILASTQSIRNYWVKTEQYRKSYWAQVTIEDEIREEGLVVLNAQMMRWYTIDIWLIFCDLSCAIVKKSSLHV